MFKGQKHEYVRSDKPPKNGAMGVVYHVKCSDSTYAVKVFHPRERLSGESYTKYLRAFLSETKIARRFKHKNLIPILDTGTTNAHGDEEPFYVMPYVEHTLRSFIQEELPETTKLVLLMQLANAITYLQSVELVHGDIKPENILIDENYQLYLADYGIMKSMNAEALNLYSLPNGRYTPMPRHYYSPEQYESMMDSSVSLIKSDSFQFGKVAAELYLNTMLIGNQDKREYSKQKQYDNRIVDIIFDMVKENPYDRPYAHFVQGILGSACDRLRHRMFKLISKLPKIVHYEYYYKFHSGKYKSNKYNIHYRYDNPSKYWTQGKGKQKSQPSHKAYDLMHFIGMSTKWSLTEAMLKSLERPHLFAWRGYGLLDFPYSSRKEYEWKRDKLAFNRIASAPKATNVISLVKPRKTIRPYCWSELDMARYIELNTLIEYMQDNIRINIKYSKDTHIDTLVPSRSIVRLRRINLSIKEPTAEEPYFDLDSAYRSLVLKRPTDEIKFKNLLSRNYTTSKGIHEYIMIFLALLPRLVDKDIVVSIVNDNGRIKGKVVKGILESDINGKYGLYYDSVYSVALHSASNIYSLILNGR